MALDDAAFRAALGRAFEQRLGEVERSIRGCAFHCASVMPSATCNLGSR